MPSNALVRMYTILQRLQDPGAVEAEPEFMPNLRSLDIFFDAVHKSDLQTTAEVPAAFTWTVLSALSSLEELSFNGSLLGAEEAGSMMDGRPTVFDNHLIALRRCRKTFHVKTLRLNIDIPLGEISVVWQGFCSLEILHLDLSNASSLIMRGNGIGNFELPSTLKVLHVRGKVSR